jgi:RNA polymerase sigma-70 factor (ECF subfamily)
MPETPGEADERRAYLELFLRENAAQLTGILRAYVVRVQPAPPAVVQSMAEEVFQDAVLETLQHADRFNPTMQPRAWFLAIATNVLRRKQSSKVRRARFEVLTSDLSSSTAASTNEAELFDQLAPRLFPGPEQEFEMREQVHELLALVSTSDADILCQALLYGLDTAALARHLGVSEGAARVRLHRAQHRLRAAWKKREEHTKGGQKHA